MKMYTSEVNELMLMKANVSHVLTPCVLKLFEEDKCMFAFYMISLLLKPHPLYFDLKKDKNLPTQ